MRPGRLDHPRRQWARGATSVGVLVPILAAGVLAPGRAMASAGACAKAYEEQRYEDAIRVCGALARRPTAASRETVLGLEVTGMAHLVLGREKQARAAFCQLLSTAPDHRPTDPIYPRRFVVFFDSVRASGCSPGVRLWIEDASTGSRAAVRLRVMGELPPVSKLAVYYRPVGARDWSRELVEVAREAEVALPGVDREREPVEIFGALLIDEDHAVARARSSDRPLRLDRLLPLRASPGPERPPAPKVPFWRHKWFWWATAGVLVVTAAVATSAALSQRHVPFGSLDTIRLPVRGGP